MDRQLLLAKKEVTYGTDAAPAAAQTIWAEQVQFQLQEGTRVTPDPAKPTVSPVADHVFGQYVQLGYQIPLIGSGTAGTAPKWGAILKACGWSETLVADTSVTYALLVNPKGGDSLTLKWRDGNKRIHVVTGWRGRAGLQLNAGQRPMLVINGKGLHTVVTEAGAELAAADADFTGWLDAKPVASGTTTFSFAAVDGLGIRQLSLNQADNVRFIDVPEQLNVDLIGDRTFTGQMQATTPGPGTLNFEQIWVDGTVETWSLTHDDTPGNIVTVNGRSQLLVPSYSRDNGDDVVSANLKCVPSTLMAADELAIVLT